MASLNTVTPQTQHKRPQERWALKVNILQWEGSANGRKPFITSPVANVDGFATCIDYFDENCALDYKRRTHEGKRVCLQD